MTTPRIALITGANKGIGLETARQLAALGITVLLGARKGKAEAEAEALRAKGVEAHSLILDITNPDERQAAHDTIRDQFGRLDILVNNAGVLLGGDTQPSTIPQDILHQGFETNFFATVALTQTLLPLIRQSKAGRIVNVSSGLGSLAQNAASSGGWHDLAYNASKASLNMFTILLARELSDTNIKVNSLHPGWVQTDMGGKAAPMSPADGAKTSVRLATLPDDGPTGGFFHQHEILAW